MTPKNFPDSLAASQMDSRELRIMFATCYGHFMSHFNMLVFPALVLPLAGRLKMDMAYVLDISFWMYLFFGVTALPWGVIADRWGARPLFLIETNSGIETVFYALGIVSVVLVVVIVILIQKTR